MAELQSTGVGDGAGSQPVADEPIAQESDEQGQPQPEQQQPARPLDLTQLPEFRQVQSAYDRQLAAMRQQMTAMQEQADQQALAGMDDFEKMEFQLQRERQEKANLLQQYQNTLAEQYRAQGMAEIAEKYQVPFQVLDPRCPDAAEASALRYLLQQATVARAASQAVETAERNRVDVGGGPANGETARMRLELKRARENNDTRAYNRIREEAAGRGVAL